MGASVSHDQQEPGSIRGEASDTSSSPPGDRPSTVPGALNIQGLVAEFHQVYGCATGVPLASAPDELIDLRIDLIQEELTEVIPAMRSGNPLAVARELADLRYVNAGAAVAFGLDLPCYKPAMRSLVADCGMACVALALRSGDLPDWLGQVDATLRSYAQLYGIDLDTATAEVHRANMSKLDDDGRPVLRTDGKVLKGPSFRPPDMRRAMVDFSVPIDGHQDPPWWLDGNWGA